MHYIMNLVKKVKFIFIIHSEDTTSMPFDTIKKLITKFISLFTKLNGQEIKELAQSCGIIITDTKYGFD